MDKFAKSNETMVTKVDTDLGIVFGWAQICKVDGKDYFDTDNQHFPEDVTLKGWAEFMEKARIAKAMHRGKQVGEVLFAMPLTSDIAKSLGVETAKTGVVVGMKVHDAETLSKFHKKEYTGFSIGGRAEFEDID